MHFKYPFRPYRSTCSCLIHNWTISSDFFFFFFELITLSFVLFTFYIDGTQWAHFSHLIKYIASDSRYNYLKGEIPLSLNVQRKLYLRVKNYAKADYHNFISYFILVLIKCHQYLIVMRNTFYLFLKILWSFKMLFTNKTH